MIANVHLRQLKFPDLLSFKAHSKYGDSSETLSRSLKDVLRYEGIAAYYDADNLSVSSRSSLI